MNAFRDWLNSQFGADGGRAVQMILALLVVVLLLIALAWLFRRVSGSMHLGGRGQRLSVVDTAPVDGRRRLLLLRRDDVEHLVMVGGPNDLLVESRILRAPQTVAARPVAPAVVQPAAPTVAPATTPRPAVTEDETAPRIAATPALDASKGAGALAAAVAGAGAFVRQRLKRPEAGAEVPLPRVAEMEKSFDAPLGRPEAAKPTVEQPPERPAPRGAATAEGGLAGLVEPPAVPAPSRPPLRPQQPTPRGEAAHEPPKPSRPTVEPSEAAPRPARAEDKPRATTPPVAAEHPKPLPATETAAIAGEIERALNDLAGPTEPHPQAARPAPTAPAPMAAAKPPAAPPPTPPATPDRPEVDLLTELGLVATRDPESPPDVTAHGEPPHPVAAPRAAGPTPPVAVERHEKPADHGHGAATIELAAIETVPAAAVPPDTPPAAKAQPAPAAPPPAEPVAQPAPAPAPAPPPQPLDALEEEMARLLAEISGQQRR